MIDLTSDGSDGEENNNDNSPIPNTNPVIPTNPYIHNNGINAADRQISVATLGNPCQPQPRALGNNPYPFQPQPGVATSSGILRNGMQLQGPSQSQHINSRVGSSSSLNSTMPIQRAKPIWMSSDEQFRKRQRENSQIILPPVIAHSRSLPPTVALPRGIQTGVGVSNTLQTGFSTINSFISAPHMSAPLQTGQYASVQQLGHVTLTVFDIKNFKAKIKKPVPSNVKNIFRLIPGSRYDKEKKRWIFPILQYENLTIALRGVAYPNGRRLHVTQIPADVWSSLQAKAAGEARRPTETDEEALRRQREEEQQLLRKYLPNEKILEHLSPFQKTGVCFVLKNGGRGIIADEMGLGKTIQGIAAAIAYRDEWPLLVLCPSSARFNWEAEILKFTDIDPRSILVVMKGGENVLRHIKSYENAIVIVSYGIATAILTEPLIKYGRQTVERKTGRRVRGPNGTIVDQVEKYDIEGLSHCSFKVAVVDESQYIKNSDAKRTQCIVPVLKAVKRVILLSGTPALSRPQELFSQLNALDGAQFSDEREFRKRYCGGSRKRGSKKKEVVLGTNLKELHAVLTATVMIRRLKKDILDLPPKKRMLVQLEIMDEEKKKEIHHLLEEVSKLNSLLAKYTNRSRKKLSQSELMVNVNTAFRNNEDMADDSNTDDVAMATMNEEELLAEKKRLHHEKTTLLMRSYLKTGDAKILAAVQHILFTLRQPDIGKVLIFGHHKGVLDALQEALVKNRINFMRIDGSTSPRKRQDNVVSFQTDRKCRVALLSVTAAGQAITLTAANRAIFVELFWTPGCMLQAEDRCHRMGQVSPVTIEYLLAKGSLDDALWPLLRKKMKVLGEMIEGDTEQDMTIDGTSSGRKVSELEDFDEDGTLKDLSKQDRDKIQGESDQESEEGSIDYDSDVIESDVSDSDESSINELIDVASDSDENAEDQPNKEENKAGLNESAAVIDLA